MYEFLINLVTSFVETAKVEIGIADSIAKVAKEIGEESKDVYEELDD